MKSVALALGGGGARGLAHIAVFEALDEMGVRPVAIAGSSIGALMGASYAAGLSGKDIRKHVVALAHNRGDLLRRLIGTRASRLTNLFTAGFRETTLVDSEKFCAAFLPQGVPEDFSELVIPLTVIASDLYRRSELPLSSGPLRPALAASMALPGLTRPVVMNERILVDGGATNPLPFDHLLGRADIVMAVDITGIMTQDRTDMPTPWESFLATVTVMGHSIVAEKLKHGAPDLFINPNVGAFRTLDFLRASAVLRASEPIKAEVKEKLGALLAK